MKIKHLCSICGSTHRVVNKTPLGPLCGRHYAQLAIHGTIKRTRFDPNEIKNNPDGTSCIVLYNRNGEPVAEAIVDTENVHIISAHKWYLAKNGYVKNSKHQYLHRVIMNESTLYVDHINGNKLDNTIRNLRVCSNTDNCKNRQVLPSNNTSGVLGVCYDNTRHKWKAEIKVDGKKLHLGRFDAKEDAIKARIEAEDMYFGNFKSKVNEAYRI